MDTTFTVIFKRGNTIDTSERSAYTAENAVADFKHDKAREFPYSEQTVYVLAVMPTEVFKLLPGGSVFFGIFPY